MTAPFIVKLLEHESAFLPRQVRTKSANEASERKREKESIRQTTLGPGPGLGPVEPADKTNTRKLTKKKHSNCNKCFKKKPLKQMA